MNDTPNPRQRAVVAVVICGLAGFILFQFFGNATRGYIATSSLFIWWVRQWFDPAAETEHGPLVLVVAVWIFFRNARRERGPAEPCPTWAMAVMLTGLGVHLIGYAAQQTRVSALALLIFVWGLLTLAGGRRWRRAAAFPCAFLLLALPVSFLDTIGYTLRLYVVESVYGLARLAGLSVIRNGTQLFAPDGHYQYDVAAACSGVRSLVALLALALLVGYLEFRSWWIRALLVVASIPAIFVGNVARISAIVFAGEWAGRESAERIHTWSGYGVFVVVIIFLLAFTKALQRLIPFAVGEDHPSDSTAQTRSFFLEPTAMGRFGFALPVIVALAAGFVGWSTVKLDHRALRTVVGVRLEEDGLNPIALPTFLGTEWIGQRVDVTAAEKEILPPDTGYSRKNYVSTQDRARQVFVSVVLSGRDRTSIHRPELCLGGQGWTIESRFLHALSYGGQDAIKATVMRIRREVVTTDGQRHIVPSLLAYWFVGGDILVPTQPAMLWRSAIDGVFHFRADRWAYIVIQTSAFDGDEPALARMENVLTTVWPGLANPIKP